MKKKTKNSELPLYNPAVSRKKDFIECPYNLRPRHRKTVNSQAVFISTRFVDKLFPCVCHHSKNSNLMIIGTTRINQTIPLPSWLKIDQNVQLQNSLQNI